MSVQAGILYFDARPAKSGDLAEISRLAASFGPDGEKIEVRHSMAMLARPFHTTPDSHRARQPFVLKSGLMVTWDGRLDNREDLMLELTETLPPSTPDIAIAVTAFEKWGTRCFEKFVGEWAMCVWNDSERELLMARDYIGVKQLFYHQQINSIIWCTFLAPLVKLADRLTICDEYVAGYLASKPEADLTPFREIRSVLPGTFVRVRNNHLSTQTFWRLRPQTIRYQNDREYEDQYRQLFRQAVKRRLHSDRPVLAALSGGLDSSSIVCMADDILSRDRALQTRVDTVSYYDPSEPEEDDHEHLVQIEATRGKKGFHLEMNAVGDSLAFHYKTLTAIPGFGLRLEVQQAMASLCERCQHRIILSGTGGDEMNGQALNPSIPIADLLVHFQIRKASQQLFDWSLMTRTPYLTWAANAAHELLPIPVRARLARFNRLQPWLNQRFTKRYRLAARQLENLPGTWFWRPAKRDAQQTITTLSRELTRVQPSQLEPRYPYLDQTLVEFLASIPFDQQLRPGERRYLMRRSLVHLVPHEVLARRTKVSASRCYTVTVAKHWNEIEQALASSLGERLGYLRADILRRHLLSLKNGQIGDRLGGLLRALSLEFWLRHISRQKSIAALPQASVIDNQPHHPAQDFSMMKGGECHEGVSQT